MTPTPGALIRRRQMLCRAVTKPSTGASAGCSATLRCRHCSLPRSGTARSHYVVGLQERPRPVRPLHHATRPQVHLQEGRVSLLSANHIITRAISEAVILASGVVGTQLGLDRTRRRLTSAQHRQKHDGRKPASSHLAPIPSRRPRPAARTEGRASVTR